MSGTIEFPHYEHISFAELIEEQVQFRPVPPSPGRLLAINRLTSGRLQSLHLRGGFLILQFRYPQKREVTKSLQKRSFLQLPLNMRGQGFYSDALKD